jgi:hypothetical protein
LLIDLFRFAFLGYFSSFPLSLLAISSFAIEACANVMFNKNFVFWRGGIICGNLGNVVYIAPYNPYPYKNERITFSVRPLCCNKTAFLQKIIDKIALAMVY